MLRFISLIALLLALPFAGNADTTPQAVSVAGFFPLDDAGRQIYDFNYGWRFHLGDVEGGEAPALDDSAWDVVSTPHGVGVLPAEGSGCRN